MRKAPLTTLTLCFLTATVNASTIRELSTEIYQSNASSQSNAKKLEDKRLLSITNSDLMMNVSIVTKITQLGFKTLIIPDTIRAARSLTKIGHNIPDKFHSEKGWTITITPNPDLPGSFMMNALSGNKDTVESLRSLSYAGIISLITSIKK